MNDDQNDRESRRNQGDARERRDGGSDADRGPRGGDGADTRFLQLEMSQVLYGEAEGVTKQAFRELLLEAAKDHLRARFGETITGLARLATDELLADIEASLDVEAQIERRRGSQGGSDDRLRAVFARGSSDRVEPAAERKAGGRAAARKRRR